MVQKQVNKTRQWIDHYRFHLLLLSTLMVLVLPAFSGTGLLSDLLFVISLSFLFVQSLIVAEVKKTKQLRIRIIVILLLVITWIQPVGVQWVPFIAFKNAAFATFFLFVVFNLFQFIKRSEQVNHNVMLTSINIYLLLGIIGASLASLLTIAYPNAYNFPEYATANRFVTFLYYSFVTMSTVGYGDITPRIPETQTLAYILAIAGQLYVAIIISFLVGKMLSGKLDEAEKN